jgi:predicted CoA-binding protein
MKTLVIGATPNPNRYAFRAVRLLSNYGHEVIPLGIRKGNIENHEIVLGKPELTDIHTVTLYVGAERQPEYYDYILGLKPKRIIFNPGTENEEFIDLARQNNIETIEDCTLVMLNSGIF